MSIGYEHHHFAALKTNVVAAQQVLEHCFVVNIVAVSRVVNTSRR